jgi:hypothetical protein
LRNFLINDYLGVWCSFLRKGNLRNAIGTATGVVLTEPGLAGIVAAVKEGRATFQRILAYTHNSVTK